MNVTWISMIIVLQINSRIFKYCLHYDVYLTINLQWNKQPSLLSWIMWDDKCNAYFLATEWNAQLTEVFQALANASSNLDLKWSRASSSDRSSFCERLIVMKLYDYINTCPTALNFPIFPSLNSMQLSLKKLSTPNTSRQNIIKYCTSGNEIMNNMLELISNAVNVTGKTTSSKCHRKIKKTLIRN